MDDQTPAARIDAKLADLGDWRGETLSWARTLILEAGPEITEAVKWIKPTNPAGVPVWEHDGIICTGEVYRSYVKLTFAHGASLDDADGLFNAGFGGGTRRAIDLHESDLLPAEPFKALVKKAAAFNTAKRAAKQTR